MEESQLVINIVLCLLLSAIFSGMEIAFISSDKLHIELQRKQGGIVARALSKFANAPSKFISTILIGNNLTLVIFGILMALLMEPWLSNALPMTFQNDIVILLLQTVLSTIIVLFTAEYIPKSIFLTSPYRMMSLFSIPFLMIYYLLSPLVFVIEKVNIFIIKGLLGLEYSQSKPVFGITDLNNYLHSAVDNSEEKDYDIDAKYLNNALDFKSVKVRECMIPRREIVAVEASDSIEELKEEFVKSGHSKVIVYQESIDDIIGYCHSLTLFQKPKSIKSILTSISIVPETMAANELLVQLIKEKKSLALVVDEYGGTSGIVSIEDIIEEIFGEIQDEHDDDDLLEIKISDSEYIFSARQEIDYINDNYKIELPEGEYDTLGGLILAINANLPTPNQIINTNNFRFEILQMEEARIEKVRIIMQAKSEEH